MRALFLVPVLFAFGCGSSGGGQKPVPVVDAGSGVDPVAPGAFVVANWNIEWFGSKTEGPTDEPLQAANVTKVMKTMDADLWSLQEIVDPAALTTLATSLGPYEAVLSSDSTVEGGSEVYANPTEQKLAIVFRSSRLSVKSARLVLRDNAAYFNGRAPMEVDLETKPGKTAVTVIVVHLSPGTDAGSYEKRKLASAALKAHLDAKPEGAFVMIAGDFNDGLETSSHAGNATPFTDLLNDPAYVFTTRGLKSPRYPRVIDHQLVTDDLAAAVIESTAKVTDGDSLVTDFVDTTSDHDPVSVRYEIP